MRALWVGLLAALFMPFCQSAEPRTEHTFRLGDGESHPDVALEDVAWLAGRWHGTGLGDGFEASWNPPSAGSMVGTFKVFDGDGVQFYELLVLSRVDGVLSLRVKHFSEKLVAWEDKDESVNFRIVRLDDDAVHFGGISFYRRGDNEMDAFIVFSGDKGLREVKPNHRRVP